MSNNPTESTSPRPLRKSLEELAEETVRKLPIYGDDWRDRAGQSLPIVLTALRLAVAQQGEDTRMLKAEIVRSLDCWTVEYERALDSCDDWIKWCEKHGDTHGMNFHQGMRSALVNHDLALITIKRLADPLRYAITDAVKGAK